MQDSKIDADGNLESDDTQQSQLPWSIKRLILWLVLFTLFSLAVTSLVGILAGLDDALEWDLITPQDELLIEHAYLPHIPVVFFAFLFWQCKKVNLTIRTIWGSHTTQVRYIIFALIFGAIVSLLWNWKIVNFDDIPAKHSDAIFFCRVIVINGSDSFKWRYCHNLSDIDIAAIFLCTCGRDQTLQKSFAERMC